MPCIVDRRSTDTDRPADMARVSPGGVGEVANVRQFVVDTPLHELEASSLPLPLAVANCAAETRQEGSCGDGLY